MSVLRELVVSLRSEAEVLRENCADSQAKLCERHAERLEEALSKHSNETLTVAEAAAESGYSKSHLRRLIREGRIPNAGEAGSPRIQRRDLPRKPGLGSKVASAEPAGPLGSRKQVARSVVESD